MIVNFRAFCGYKDWAWVNEQVPILRVEDTGGLVAFNAENGELIGACIWDNWTSNSVQCHFMLSNKIALKHGFLQEIFDYIFNVRKRKFIYGMIPSDNIKALKFNKHLGFTEKMRLEDAWRDGIDYVVMELKKGECRYFPTVE